MYESKRLWKHLIFAQFEGRLNNSELKMRTHCLRILSILQFGSCLDDIKQMEYMTQLTYYKLLTHNIVAPF